jgi:hypothetical protein
LPKNSRRANNTPGKLNADRGNKKNQEFAMMKPAKRRDHSRESWPPRVGTGTVSLLAIRQNGQGAVNNSAAPVSGSVIIFGWAHACTARRFSKKPKENL